MNSESDILLEWYQQQSRTLPWRETSDPYAIWISEVILQQTRVAQGISYYRNFLEVFPDVQSLAAAPIEAVLKQWQGLGYYSRARNLHQAARQVMTDFGGEIPGNYQELLSLKGVGAYTAAAIASIAFSEQVVAIDGNVNRVISRLYALTGDPLSSSGRKLIQDFAVRLSGNHPAGLFNQVLMEFGALQCIPRPDCESCPLKTRCEARHLGMVGELPVRKKKLKIKDRYFYYAVVRFENQYWVRQRGAGDVWQGLYEFPLLETEVPMEDFSVLASKLGSLFISAKAFVLRSASEVFVHVLSHQKIHAVFCLIHTSEMPQFSDYEVFPVSSSEILNLPVSRLMERYFQLSRIIP